MLAHMNVITQEPSMTALGLNGKTSKSEKLKSKETVVK
jgi:hypothetical protein